MKLGIRQTAFKAAEITYLDRKPIQLDRMLLKLFEALRYDGRPIVRRKKKPLEVDDLVNEMAANTERFPGFADHPDVARAWLRRDLLQIMNRDKPGSETLVGPRPFHLNAFKLTNPKAVSDYGASDQVRAFIYHADPPLLATLKSFFGRGLDQATDQYDRQTNLDLETRAILGLADQVRVDPGSTPASPPFEPLCKMQGALMAEDLRRLLAYEDQVPRHVLAGYVRDILGLHLALYLMRLFKLLPQWVEAAMRHEPTPMCPMCPSQGGESRACPYSVEIVVDLTEAPNSPTALLARQCAAEHINGISSYVRAVIAIHRVKELMNVPGVGVNLTKTSTVRDSLDVLRNPPPKLEGFYLAKISELISLDPGEELDSVAQEILNLDLSSLDKYVELIAHQRMKVERKHLVDLLDALCQKNRPGGFMTQTVGRGAPRRFTLSSQLLECLVQIAVLERHGPGGEFRPRNLLVEDFVEWLRTRYGIVVYTPAHREVTASEQPAWTANKNALRERLHQIGFYSDLSDAFNSQTLRPRYEVHVGHA